MRIVRILLAFYFVFCAVILFLGVFAGLRTRPWSDHLSFIDVVLRFVIPAVLVIIFGIATHVAARERLTAKISGKAWTISACVLSLLFTVGFPFFYMRHGASAFWSMQKFFAIPTALGIVGLVAFSSVGSRSAGGS